MGNVERMGCERSACRAFKGETEDLEVFAVVGDGVKCIYVAKYMDRYCGFVNSSETSDSIKCRNLLIVW